MNYIIGIDSGGTNYRVKACSLAGEVLGYSVGRPASWQYLSPEALKKQIEENIDACLSQFKGRREDMKALVCGTTGIDSDGDLVRLEQVYQTLQDISCPVLLMNDAELAHRTVTGGDGILLISGTGSIAVGRNPRGETARAGGWPVAMLGDEGSGSWVTKMALRHVGRWLDHAVEKTELTTLICSELSIKTREDLINLALECGVDPSRLPMLGPLVNQAADQGDPYAIELLKKAALELEGIILDIVSALDLASLEPDFKLGLWGSNLLKSQVLLSYFTERIHMHFPLARICLPEKEAIDGAVDIALKLVQG